MFQFTCAVLRLYCLRSEASTLLSHLAIIIIIHQTLLSSAHSAGDLVCRFSRHLFSAVMPFCFSPPLDWHFCGYVQYNSSDGAFLVRSIWASEFVSQVDCCWESLSALCILLSELSLSALVSIKTDVIVQVWFLVADWLWFLWVAAWIRYLLGCVQILCNYSRVKHRYVFLLREMLSTVKACILRGQLLVGITEQYLYGMIHVVVCYTWSIVLSQN